MLPFFPDRRERVINLMNQAIRQTRGGGTAGKAYPARLRLSKRPGHLLQLAGEALDLGAQCLSISQIGGGGFNVHVVLSESPAVNSTRLYSSSLNLA